MYAFILSYGGRLCGVWPHTPCLAPYLRYGRILWGVLLCFSLCGCASLDARESAKDTVESYLSACVSGREGSARDLLMPEANLDVPCPESSVVSQISVAGDLVYVANTGRHHLVDSGSGWQIDIHSLLTSNSPEGVLSRLRDALFAGDMEALEALILPEDVPSDMERYYSGHVSLFNGLYAAISSMSTPWFQMEGKRALCDVSGILLTFEVREGRWFWVLSSFAQTHASLDNLQKK